MNTEIISKVDSKFKKNVPELEVGDTVVVSTIIRDGDKKRIQKFKGIVLSVKGSGSSKTFTVRKISYGIGVEKTFPFNSTNIESIEVLRHAKVRRSKLYYLRNRIGKAAMKLKGGKDLVIEDETPEPEVETENVSEEATVAEEKSSETK